MTGEDVYTTYLNTWRLSDERRFHLAEANKKLEVERTARLNIKQDFEDKMQSNDKVLDELSEAKSALEEKVKALEADNHRLSLQVADNAASNSDLMSQLEQI